ncbi:hypothetical protein, partial [Sinomonas atrocyanea]|uniref:hypothetical protein n=1 Tax=Sinomonas atrocyanea TaxID=37927 RepID=UPI001E297CAF
MSGTSAVPMAAASVRPPQRPGTASDGGPGQFAAALADVQRPPAAHTPAPHSPGPHSQVRPAGPR